MQLNKRTIRGLRVLALLGLLTLLALLIDFEGYFPLYPEIDTFFAPQYSEAAFSAIHPGMNQSEVLARLGPPLSRKGSVWWYTLDGAFPVWDFAWIGRSIRFDDQGHVVDKSARIYYD